jgi:ankyrin repeat protein
MTNSFSWRICVITILPFAAAMAILLSPLSGWGQSADLATFAPAIQQKLEARSAPAKITNDDESALASKGYVKIGTISASQPGNRANAAATEQLQTAILRKAAEAGGDFVRFSKEGIFEERDVPTGKTKRKGGTCEEYKEQTVSGTPSSSTSCYTDVHGFSHCMTWNTPTTRSISSCVRWVGGEEIPITKRDKSVVSEGTVWRYDPHGDIARAEEAARQRTAADRANFLATIDGAHFIKGLEDDKYTFDDINAMVNANPGLLTAENSYGESPLHVAAEKGSVRLVEFFLAKGADVNAKAWAWHGDTPLHTAARCGQIDVVKVLLAHGVDANIMNTYNETPLHNAELFHKTEVAELLRTNGGPDIARAGEAAREAARKKAGTDTESLLAHRGDINARDSEGYTALIRAIRKGKLDEAEALLDHGADVNAPAGEPAIDKGDTPLLEASTFLPGLMKTLVERGANVDAADIGKDTPLYNAACGRDPEILKLLVAKGANINMQDSISRSPLMHAASCGDPENVKVLLASGADRSLKDFEGKTAADLAREGMGKADNSVDRAKYQQILQLLRQ